MDHYCTHEKRDKVFAVVKEYRVACRSIAKNQWRLFFNGEKFNKMGDLFFIKSPLSERYKRNCCYQVVGSLESYISNRQNDFVSMVYNSGLDEETRIKLLQINRRQLWFKTEHKLFTPEQLKLARKIFKYILNKNRRPNFSKCNMLLNANVAEIISADKSITIGFDYWIKFSTLEKGKPILIPILVNDYFKNIPGKICAGTQFNFSGKEFSISLMKDLSKIKMEFKTEKLSLDFGLKSLFTAADGKMFGNNFYGVLLTYDGIISTLAKNRQKQKLDIKSSRYTGVVSNLKSFIKNEINRVLNRIVKLYKPKQIILENLDFRNSSLSKRLNRILRNCGRSVIREKIESLKNIYGIEIKLINAAYTSQECNKCHYVEKNNRKTQETFKCKNCRHVIHADVNAARVQEYRSSMPKLANIYTNRKVILREIVTLFMKRQARLNSKAKVLLQSNPYFKDYLQETKQVA